MSEEIYILPFCVVGSIFMFCYYFFYNTERNDRMMNGEEERRQSFLSEAQQDAVEDEEPTIPEM